MNYTIFFITCVGAGFLIYLLRIFTKKKNLILIVLFPVVVFGIGYTLRLSSVKEGVDLGFFFTDFSFLFVYLVFAMAFLLGQIRYWRKDN